MNRNFELKMMCERCGEAIVIEVNKIDYVNWLTASEKNSVNISEFMPYLTSTELDMIENELCEDCLEELAIEAQEFWGLDEDFGFDPYCGCYTFDC